mmetsp:Transcript_116895/g.162396  ORF Transcript_116895/g.162396 Transcript_116895/m.162396 type:complete len:238 (-) Transcript_116895:1567-2280(-)
MHMDSNHSFNLGSDKLGLDILQTEFDEFIKDTVHLLLLLIKFRKLLLSGSLQTVLGSGSPEHLKTEKGNLRWVVINEVSENADRLVVLRARFADTLDRLLHFLFEAAEPVLNVTLSLDTVNKGDSLFITSEDLMDRDNLSSVDFIEADSVDSIEKLLEVILYSVGIGTNGQESKQIGVRAEIETWEKTSLLFEVTFKLLLAELETLLEITKGTLQDIVVTALNNVLLLVSTLHNLQP